ncbi:MAG: hypothetical protein ACAI44_21170 [Candidatus Sericytochromatia bacterium]
MLELGPNFTPKTWEALKKLDKDNSSGVSLQELNAVNQDGIPELSDAELLAAGIDQEDIPAVRQELGRKAHDPQTVIFELPEAPAPATAGSGSNLSGMMSGLGKNSLPTGGTGATGSSGPSALSQADLEALKKSALSDADLSFLKSFDASEVHFPAQESASKSDPQSTQAETNEVFVNLGIKHIQDRLPKGMSLTADQITALKRIIQTCHDLPRGTEQSKFDLWTSLTQLAATNRLTPELLGAISDMADPAKTPLHPELEQERGNLINSALGEIANPSQIAQGHKNTCAGTTCQILFAVRSPVNYLRTVAALASPSGKVPAELLPGRATLLCRDENTLKDDKSGRTLSSRLIQPAFMEYANDAQGDFISWMRGGNYDNAKDVHSGILPDKWKAGLIMSEITHLLGGIYPEGEYRPVIVRQPNAAAQAYAVFGKGDPLGVDDTMDLLKKRLGEGKPVPVGIRWSVNDELNFHALLVTRVDTEKNLVYFLNPHGKAQSMDLADFQSRITAMADPMEAPGLPGNGDAMSRMPEPLNATENFRPIEWHSYRKLSEQLEQDPDLIRVLSDDQRSLIEDRFEELKIPKQSLQDVMDLVKAGRFTHSMLDRLSNARDAAEGSKLLSLYRNLDKLEPDARQNLLAAYPERYLNPQEFSKLTVALNDLEFGAGGPAAEPHKQTVENLTRTAQQAMQQQLAPATGAAPGARPDAKQILARFAQLRDQGNDAAYDQISQLASLADAPTKAAMIRSLFEGNTPEKAERAIGLIVGNATVAEQNQILASLDLYRFGNEMENIDRAAEILNVISKAGFDPATLESHMLKFFDGVDSQSGIFNGTDDDLAGAFVRRLDQKGLEAIPENVKLRFFKALDSGDTKDYEYAWMRKLAQGSDPATKAQMLKFLMDQSDTNGSQENLISQIVLDTPAEPGPKGEKSPFLQMLDGVDARQLADELENDKQAGAVAAGIARAYTLGGVKPIQGKLHDFLSCLAKDHREQAINAFIDSPTTQHNSRAIFKAIAPETLKGMMSALMNGDTDEAEEDTIVKILANTDFEQYGRILGGDKAFMARLDDELDSEDMDQIAKWNQQYADWQRQPRP